MSSATDAQMPDRAVLAEIATNVAETLFQASFACDAAAPTAVMGGTGQPTHSIKLDMAGKPSLRLAISWQDEQGRSLGSQLYACPPADLDEQMVTDAFGEWANIIAGQLKSQLGSEHALGLPQADQANMNAADSGQGGYGLWIVCENPAAQVRVQLHHLPT